jgi:heme-degrading monooxygenase HmoA
MYAYVWEFDVDAAERERFERLYGPDGPWVALFRRADGYLGTELLRDRDLAGRYLTIDRWRDADAWSAFSARFGAEYAALDRECDGLASSERALGYYDAAP